MGASVDTGDADADRVLRLIIARAGTLPQNTEGDDVRAGVQSLPLKYTWLVGQADIDSIRVRSALQKLHDNGFIRVDFGYPQSDGSPNVHGVNVWLRAKLEEVA